MPEPFSPSSRPARVLPALALGLAVLAGGPALRAAEPVTSHPRLWVTEAELPRLRGRATDANPVWRDGLARLAARAKETMDRGEVPGPDEENGGYAWVAEPAEAYAKLFAFLSLVSPVEADREDYSRRARTLLMYVVGKALPGAAEGRPYRHPEFSTNDRSRWHGESFALAVDWIYPSLTADEGAAIRTVFLRWIDENRNAAITGRDHPEPIGVVNDPRLVDSPEKLRWALNNTFTAHMRNVGLMAMALDGGDDPGGRLRGALNEATGAWLAVFDRASRTVGQGGLGPEGFEYFPQTFGYAAQLMLALRTAGHDDPALHGPQVSAPGNPFWDEVVAAMLHSLSPAPSFSETEGRSVHLPAWYGSGQHDLAQDMIGLFGPLGVLDGLLGNAARRDASRFLQLHLAPGGADELARRAYDTSGYFQNAILYFLLFDPSLPPPVDPRPSLPTSHFAPGLGRLLARTDWSPSVSWFTYKLGFNAVDHQFGDGHQVELYRKGEWLTKERTGYDLEYGGSQNHDTLAILNDRPATDDPCLYRGINWRQGAQWEYVATGDPRLLARGAGPDFAYALGDAVNLYNSEREDATDVVEASRSVLWLPPDHVVVYDRAATKTDGRPADGAGLLRFPEATVPEARSSTLLVPIVLSSTGVNGAFFTSELTLTNRGTTDAQVTFAYAAAFGGGSGSAVTTLPAGRQVVVPDAIAHLRALGVPLPPEGNRGGPLRVTFTGLSAARAGAVTVRTTTAVAGGRAGLSYAGVPAAEALTGPSWLFGLRESATDRSNVAVQNAGSPSDGDVTLRLSARPASGGAYGVFAAATPAGRAHTGPVWLYGLRQDAETRTNLALVDTGESGASASTFRIELHDGATGAFVRTIDGVGVPASGWTQLGAVLSNYAPGLVNAYARVTRVAGTNPYLATLVVNDGGAPGERTGDGAFVPAQPE